MANIVHYTKEELIEKLDPTFFLDENSEECVHFVSPLHDDGSFYGDVAPDSTEACGSLRQDMQAPNPYDPDSSTEYCIYWNEPPAPTSKYGLVLSHRIGYFDGSKYSFWFKAKIQEQYQKYNELIARLAVPQYKTIALSDGKEYDRALLLQPDNSLVELSGLTFSN